jgi:deoxyribodipyrimidine photo-lyase
MRQLAAQGWMPFAFRHYVACFFVKVLLLDYRRGENHFMRHLLDGDIAQNNALWQEAASFSPLSPAQPPSFDPIAEADRLDPGGVYRDEWQPKASSPIVDWERQSELCREMYEEARSGQAAKRSIQEQIDSEVGQSFWEKTEA